MEQRAAVVRAFWEAMERRDWQAAGECLAPDVIVDWPLSDERIRGRDAVIDVNRAYPGEWHIVIERILMATDEVIAQVRATIDDLSETCLGFYHVKNNQIVRATEWWATPYVAPAWRTPWTEPLNTEESR